VTPEVVANHAKTNIGRMPKWHNVNFEAQDAIRGVYRADKPFNCYNGCIFWAFQAGAISKRYIWNKLQNKDGNAFFPIFYPEDAWDTLIEYDAQKRLVRDTSNGGQVVVPAGRTVYFVTPVKKFGHVACSLGDGTVISQNCVNIGDSGIANLQGAVKTEFTKMANAVTHTVSIRDMLTHYFNPEHGYQKLQITADAFWNRVPLAER